MSQETDIIEWFNRYPRRLATPQQVHKEVLPDSPLTSVRRAMTNLATQGLLRKTSYTGREPNGRWCRLWALAKNPEIPEQKDLL